MRCLAFAISIFLGVCVVCNGQTVLARYDGPIEGQFKVYAGKDVSIYESGGNNLKPHSTIIRQGEALYAISGYAFDDCKVEYFGDTIGIILLGYADQTIKQTDNIPVYASVLVTLFDETARLYIVGAYSDGVDSRPYVARYRIYDLNGDRENDSILYITTCFRNCETPKQLEFFTITSGVSQRSNLLRHGEGTTTAKLNMRWQPSIFAASELMIPFGSNVTILDCNLRMDRINGDAGFWIYAEYTQKKKDYFGWIFSPFVKFAPEQ